MRQKLITLCPNSFELALKKDNFSEWVRKRLLEEADLPKEEYLFKCRACNYQHVYPTRSVKNCPTCGFRLTLVPSIQLQLPGDDQE